MAALGIKVIIVTNAAGGVNPKYNIGDLMIIKDQICAPGLAGNHPLVGKNDERFGVRFPAVSPVFDVELQNVVESAHKTINSRMTIKRGVYFGVSGPSYETPYEIGMIRTLRGDSVGMSTVFEILTAAHCGLKLLGLSLITNRCLGPDDNFEPPTHEEVLSSVKKGEADVQALVSEIVTQIKLDNLPRTKAYNYFLNPPKDATAASPAAHLAHVSGSEVKDGEHKRSGHMHGDHHGRHGHHHGGLGGLHHGDKQGDSSCGTGEKKEGGCCGGNKKKWKKRCGGGERGCCKNKKSESNCCSGSRCCKRCPLKGHTGLLVAAGALLFTGLLLKCSFNGGHCQKK